VKQPIYLVDAFASKPYEGNPAGVCLLAEIMPEGWMQNVAMEMNQAETAFVKRRADEDYDLRWFTPTDEVDLCGHATLASAHVLFETSAVPPDQAIRFHTRSGVLTAEIDGDRILLDFPSEDPVETPAPAELVNALAVKPLWSGRNRMDWLLLLEDESSVRSVTPRTDELARIDARGVIVTAPGGPGSDFTSRFFAPAVGVPEDAVTGSAHCALAPFWASRLGRPELVGYQASRRGGWVGVHWKGSRTVLKGRAIITMIGELL
jgi:PhzF family phenazine biosynthesis protein